MGSYRKKTIDYISDHIDMDIRDHKIRLNNSFLEDLIPKPNYPKRIKLLAEEFNLGIKAIERILASKDD